jgi:Methylamine utilisation protein MauE
MAIDPTFELSIRLFLGGLFALACLHKATDIPRFGAVIRSYFRTFTAPGSFTTYCLAFGVIFAEFGIAFAAVSMQSSWLVGCLASIMLLIYTLGMGINIIRGNRLLDCGCSWGSETPVSGWMIFRNLILIAASGVLLLPAAARQLTAMEITSSVALAFCLYIFYLLFDQIVLNQTSIQGAQR